MACALCAGTKQHSGTGRGQGDAKVGGRHPDGQSVHVAGRGGRLLPRRVRGTADTAAGAEPAGRAREAQPPCPRRRSACTLSSPTLAGALVQC